VRFSPLFPELFATEDGDVFLWGVTPLSQSPNSNGYARVRYMRDGRLTTRIAHRVIASAWCDGYTAGLCVNHKDGNKLNNAASNLEWVTREDNIRHAYATGLNNQSGESHSRSKLSASDVDSIREMLSRGVRTMEIASAFNIGQRQIYYIKNGGTWAKKK